MILGKDIKLHKMLKILQIFPKLYRCLLNVVFHNLEFKMQGLLMLKGIYIKKRSKGIFQKISTVIKNVIWSEKTFMHKAVRPSNYFFQFFHI